MALTEVIQKLVKFKKAHMEEYRFRRIGVFGSVARGTSREGSDLDILVEQLEPDLFLLGTIKTDLEEEFGVPVDIIRIREGMDASLKKRIDREAFYV